MVGAAKSRAEPLNHILLGGPPGLGKTTLSLILGNEMEKQVSITSGPVIDKPADLAGLLTNLNEGDILFIDEIHRIPKTVEEYLYSAMEDFRIDIMIDQGPNARSVRLNLPRFTLLGATTRMGLLTAPLRSRFTLQSRLSYYDQNTLQGIVERTCGLLDVEFTRAGASEIARRARGTPRIANNLVNFCRDYAQQRSNGTISESSAMAALELLEIDQRGLDEMDKQILRLMAENYKGGPVGLRTVASRCGRRSPYPGRSPRAIPDSGRLPAAHRPRTRPDRPRLACRRPAARIRHASDFINFTLSHSPFTLATLHSSTAPPWAAIQSKKSKLHPLLQRSSVLHLETKMICSI